MDNPDHITHPGEEHYYNGKVHERPPFYRRHALKILVCVLLVAVILLSVTTAVLLNQHPQVVTIKKVISIVETPTLPTDAPTPTPTLTPTPSPIPNNIVKDGSFEMPFVNGNSFNTYSAGQTFGDWTVTSGSIDLIGGGYWQAADGLQSVDMDGTTDGTPGVIFQNLNTTVGKTYNISFSIAGNGGGTPIKRMEVWWGSNLLDTLSFDTTGITGSSMGWTSHSYTATATNNTTRLMFRSITPGDYGVALDNVSVSLTA